MLPLSQDLGPEAVTASLPLYFISQSSPTDHPDPSKEDIGMILDEKSVRCVTTINVDFKDSFHVSRDNKR